MGISVGFLLVNATGIVKFSEFLVRSILSAPPSFFLIPLLPSCQLVYGESFGDGTESYNNNSLSFNE